MSDVEKAISGLVEDEELLQAHQQQQKKQLHYQQQQQQQQQQEQQQQHQQQATIAVNKININSYNLQNETGNSSLLQKQSCYYKQPVQQPHQQQQETNLNTTTYLTAKRQNCLSRLAKLLYSTPGLVIMVVAYTIMGAFIFPLLEAPQDITKSALIAKSREECLKELWIITEKLNVLYERNWTILVHEQLRRFEGTIVAATRNMATGATSSPNAAAGGGGGVLEDFSMATEATATSLGRFGNSNSMEYSDLTATKWTFGEALLYSVTVITTIGHGSLTPRTAGGKIATILYALIGVPLMLMCLSSLGGLLAEALQCTYARICCHLPQYAVEDGDDLDQVVDHGNRSHRQYFKRQSKQPRKVEINVEKATTHQCDYHQHPNDKNCKNCKYDAIIGETKGMHGYDYKQCNDAATAATPLLPSSPPSSGTASATAIATPAATASANTTATASASAMPTMNLGHKEDCCQLLQNSSGKVTKHLSSCMQLKMSPTMSGSVLNATTATTAQQQQQQYYQQRPDVMLMTTGHKVSAQQPTTVNTNCRMLLPPTLPTTPAQRFYANAAPAIATYHLVSSASANSSPTHQQSIRHYILPQMPPPSPLPSTSLTSTTGTQHFMAVPSAMIRFHHQTSPQTSVQQQQQYSVNTTSNLNINPLSLPAPATATVYFPIVTPAAVAADSSSSDSKNTTQQSLVKYHTIQMPHKRQRGLSLYQPTDLHDNQVVTAVEDIDSTLFPPPPPPAYHTATVHGIRRAKFLAKPLPQEINTLLHENDISSRHDLSQNFKTFNNSSLAEQQQPKQQQQQHEVTTAVYTPGTHSVRLSNENSTNVTEGSTAVTTAVNSFYGSSNASSTTASSSPASTATLTNNTNSNNTNIYENHDSATMHSLHSQQTPAVNLPMGLMLSGGDTICEESATATVDIMEDEEEQEQQRLGNCPHGTPSRVPLLTSSSNFMEDKAQKRGFLNATAASFHRHTSNTFQRSSNSMANQAKSVIINRKGECNLHMPKRRNSSSATICYGDQYDDTSEDENGALKGADIYELKHLHPCQTARNQNDKHLTAADFYDNYSLVSLSDSVSQVPQVPIILVVFILTFYVCLGTVIFALWENWSLVDGAYFCFVTLTTIGYGDFMPWRTFQGPEIQLFACCAYLLLGLVLVAMSFNILETQLIWKCKRLAVRLKLAKE